MPGVSASCSYRLSSFEPVVEVLVRLEYFVGGWSLWVRHRHYGGLFGDCDPMEFSSLSTGEMLDVLCAVLEQYGPFSCELTAVHELER